MTPIAPHITAFLKERLPLERAVSDNTCASYAYAFKLLLHTRVAVSRFHRRGSISNNSMRRSFYPFSIILERERGNGPSSRNSSARCR